MADVRLTTEVDTSGVAAGMAAIQNQVEKTGNSIAATFTRYFTTSAILAAFQHVVDAADKIHLESARFGLDAEQLQLVTNAAKQLGLDIGTVARVMNLLEINAQKALDPTTKQALAMEHLGLSAKQFAALNPEQQFLALADAYKNSAQDGAAYADVAELIGRRNTEIITILAMGSQKIKEMGNSFAILKDQEIEALHAVKVEEDKYFSNLFSWLAKAIVNFGHFFDYVRAGFANFGQVLQGQTLTDQNRLQPGFQSAADLDARKKYLESITITPPAAGSGAGAPVGAFDEAAGGGGGIGASGGSIGNLQRQARLAAMDDNQKLNELIEQRQFLQDALNSGINEGVIGDATAYKLKKQIATVDAQIVPLQNSIADAEERVRIAEEKGVETADRKIQQSQDQLAIDELIASGHEQEAALLQTELDFNEKIQKALDDANDARNKGLDLTAAENEKLAAQLELQKQDTLELQKRNAYNEAYRGGKQSGTDQFGRPVYPNDITIGALASGKLSEGFGREAFGSNLAFQQYQAQVMLESLTGRNTIGFAQRASLQGAEDAALNAEQQKAIAAAKDGLKSQIEYWQNIANGTTELNKNNPFTAFYGTNPYMPNNATPSAADQQAIMVGLLSQMVNSGQLNTTLLTQLVANTKTVGI
jgi:hypothetical protein